MHTSNAQHAVVRNASVRYVRVMMGICHARRRLARVRMGKLGKTMVA